jgi:cytochrome c oxidase cbb3-type subunit 3
MMSRSSLLAIIVAIACVASAGCNSAPGRPKADSIPIAPDEVANFQLLYAQNCSGCHGPDGKKGAAISLGDPVYLAIADDEVIRRATAVGVFGTSMPAFAQSAGGMLTDKQINIIVSGMRTHWAQPEILRNANPPPYAQTPGDAARGAKVYAFYCSSCHGLEGHGTQKGSSIVNGSYLALVSNQGLRISVIIGWPQLGAPDWRGDIPGKPMSSEEISDVVAWLAAQRVVFSGQPYPAPPAEGVQ